MSRTNVACFVITILGAIGAVVLSAKVVANRRARLEPIETKFAELENLGDKTLDDQRAIDALTTQLLTNKKEWGTVWPDAQRSAVTDPDVGEMQLGIGLNAGIGASVGESGTLPTLHVFGVQGGQTKYVGEFQTTNVDAASTTIQLERAPIEGEADGWVADGYRVRDAIPSSYNALLDDLITTHNIAAQSLLEEQQRLARSQKQLEASETGLNTRMDELSGNPLIEESVDEVRSKGLVKLLDDKSAERDDVAASVDRLRRTYLEKSEELVERLARLRELADRLPGGDAEKPTFNNVGRDLPISR